MNELSERLLNTESGKELYSDFLKAIKDFSMLDTIKRGVLIGLSGGADSVALLLLLLKLKDSVDFNLKAVHVNHMIRGADADNDELFAKNLCDSLKVDFVSFKIDVPLLAEKTKTGVEEAARNARYEIFNKILKSDRSLSVIAVAHNSTDNLETIIFNMMRGAGSAGLCGISPVRDNIIRPIIYSSKKTVCDALNGAGINFVEDKTNYSTEYSRNYIRHEIIPRLTAITDNPEKMGIRVSQNISEDNSYILNVAKQFVLEKQVDSKFRIEDVKGLAKPVFSRVLLLLCREIGAPAPEKVHIDSIYELLNNKNFEFSLPGKISCFLYDGLFWLGDCSFIENEDFCFGLKLGLNSFEGFCDIILITKEEYDDCFSNIYKKSIQLRVKSDIISNGLHLRSKREGDTYLCRNMTRKLKKHFCDKKIPKSERKNVPLLCDKDGILWVEGLGFRDGLDFSEVYYVTFLRPQNYNADLRSFYVGLN